MEEPVDIAGNDRVAFGRYRGDDLQIVFKIQSI